MTSEERLAEVYASIVDTGIRALVMGGHAVRFYGVDRTTIDMHVTGVDWDRLPEVVAEAFGSSGALAEGPSWRPRDFRRFIIGRLSDGREERLESRMTAPSARPQVRRSRPLRRVPF